jgi:ubiquinone/menaquinone biosynthesis C-methylase UbiE
LTNHYSKNKKIGLDIGCKFRPYEDEYNCEYVGLDLPSEIFKEDTKKPHIYGTGESLPFLDNSFDFITTYSVVPYVKNIDNFFNEMHRVLKPSGTAVIIIMNLRGLNLQPKTHFENRYTSSQLINKLKQHGFTSIKNKNLKTFALSNYYDITSVYAYAIVTPKKSMNSKVSNFNSRIYLRSKLSRYSKLYSVSRNLYRQYCKITHNLHTTPTYLIIGAAKCGTSSLHEYLMQHPDVGKVLTKQLHFFDQFYDRGIEWYKVCLPFIWQKFFTEKLLKKNYATGEATAHYINHPSAPKRVAEILPNVKIIVMLRNPIDRTYSHYQMELNNNNENLSFEDAISAEPNRIKDELIEFEKNESFSGKNFPHRAYVSGSKYAEQLKKWFKYFPKEQFHFVKAEDFNNNPSQVYNDVLKFLNLRSHELPEYKKFRERKYEKMKPETRKKLAELFKPYNDEFYSLIDMNFGWDDV